MYGDRENLPPRQVIYLNRHSPGIKKHTIRNMAIKIEQNRPNCKFCKTCPFSLVRTFDEKTR